MRDILRQAGPAILALASLTFDVGNFFGSALIAYAIWVAAAIWAGYVYWPGIKRWRPFTLAPANLNNPDTEVVAKRKAVKDLLGDALDQGNILRQSHRKDDEGRIKITSYQDVVAWVD